MTAVHVVPVADGMAHVVPGGYTVPGPAPRWVVVEAVGAADDCPCTPASELVRREGGPDGWVVTHRSLDGREHREVAA